MLESVMSGPRFKQFVAKYLLLTSTWVWVNRRDLTLNSTLSSFSMGPMVHLMTVQVLGPHLSSSDWNSAKDRFGL